MDINFDGILTVLTVVIGAAALGGGLFYAMTQHKARDKASMERAGKQADS